MRDQGGNFQVYGIDGINLHQLWGQKPEAYYGIISILRFLTVRHRSQPIPQLLDHVWTQFCCSLGESHHSLRNAGQLHCQSYSPYQKAEFPPRWVTVCNDG
jgi:hypothetical protein